jgi:hypothetical protein
VLTLWISTVGDAAGQCKLGRTSYHRQVLFAYLSRKQDVCCSCSTKADVCIQLSSAGCLASG